MEFTVGATVRVLRDGKLATITAEGEGILVGGWEIHYLDNSGWWVAMPNEIELVEGDENS